MIIMFTIILARMKVMKSCSEYDVKVVKGDFEFARSTCDLNGDWCLGWKILVAMENLISTFAPRTQN